MSPGSPQGQTARSERFSMAGKVRILINKAPWRLSLTAASLNISATGLLALIPPNRLALAIGDHQTKAAPAGEGSLSQGRASAGGKRAAQAEHEPMATPGKTRLSADDIGLLLGIGKHYRLQIEHGEDFAAFPIVKARLTRRELRPEGLQLGFVFTAKDSDLLTLVHELSIKA